MKSSVHAIYFIIVLCVFTLQAAVGQTVTNEESTEAERSAFITQVGMKNAARILQLNPVPGFAATAEIVQYYEQNIAVIEDYGYRNRIGLYQTGIENQAELRLFGSRNIERIGQTGEANLFLLTSTAHEDIGLYSQTGKDNMLIIEKHDATSVPVEIHQAGTGMQLIIK